MRSESKEEKLNRIRFGKFFPRGRIRKRKTGGERGTFRLGGSVFTAEQRRCILLLSIQLRGGHSPNTAKKIKTYINYLFLLYCVGNKMCYINFFWKMFGDFPPRKRQKRFAPPPLLLLPPPPTYTYEHRRPGHSLLSARQD